MKLEGLIKCPFCGSENTHAYQRTDVTIWDDEFHKILNEGYPNDNKLNCDTITYKCKCNEENCNKSFIAKLKLKCEIENIIVVKNESDLCDNYFEK